MFRTPLRSNWSLRTPIADPATVFAVVADVERYGEFIRGVDARIVRRDGPRWDVENEIGVGPLQIRFLSVAEAHPPTDLTIVSTDGPWRSFSLRWRVTPDAEGCVLACEAELGFRSLALDLLARAWFERVEPALAAKFDRRLKSLEGSAT